MEDDDMSIEEAMRRHPSNYVSANYDIEEFDRYVIKQMSRYVKNYKKGLR